jgi:hypothetical protein
MTLFTLPLHDVAAVAVAVVVVVAADVGRYPFF